MSTNSNHTSDRLEEQIAWYDRESISNQRWYKRCKVGEVAIAATIPLAAGLGWSAYVTGGLGVAIVISEGLQNLNQFHHNWITYRSTCEELKHEKHLWLAKAGPYADVENPDTLLAERIESLVSREHTKWVAGRKQMEHGKK